MKTLKLKWLLLSIVLSLASINTAKAWTISSAKVYFDNTNSAYDCGVRFVIEKSDGCCVQSMSLIDGTNNLYYWSGTWGDGAVSNLRFASASYTTGWYSWWSNVGNLPALASAESFCSYTNTYGTDVNSASKLFFAASGSSGANLTKTDLNAYSSLNYTQTLYQCVAENGGIPAKSTASIGTISITTKNLKNANTTQDNNGSISSGQNNVAKSAARTATVTMTATSIADGYSFLGWYTAETGGTRLESSTTYTYQASAAKTVYARFSHETTHSVNITYVCASPSATVSTATSQAIGQETASSITAPTVYGYTFTDWTLGNGISNQSANTSANPISVKTLSSGTYTMQANYTEDLSSTWYVSGELAAIFGGWGSSGKNMQRKTGHSTEKRFYYTIDATKVINGDVSDSDLEFKIYNSSGDSYRGNNGYWVTRDNYQPTLSSSSGSNMQFRPDAYGTYEFKLDCESPYSESAPKLTVTFGTKRKVTFGKRTGGNTVTAKYKNSVSMTSNQYVISGSSVTFAQTANTGYTFEGWYDASSGGTRKSTSSSITATVDADITRYSNYTENSYNATVSAGANGDVSPKGTVSIKQATGTSITATPSNGYYFSSWTISGGGITPTTSSTTPQTFKATSTGGTIQANFAQLWYLKGGFNSWGTTHPFVFTSATSGYVDVDLSANSSFKLYNAQTGAWYGSEYGIEQGTRLTTTLWSNNNSNCPINITSLAGTWRFTIDVSGSDPEVTAAPPTINQLRISAADPADATNTNNFDLVEGSSNNWSVSRTLNARTTYTFKIVSNSAWYGKNSTALTRASASASSLSTSGANMTITTDVAGSYTFTFNSGSKNLSVTYPEAYTVTFGYGTGGGEVTASATSAGGAITSGAWVAAGDNVTFTQTPSSSGYTFAGWYDAESGGSAVPTMGVSDNVLNSIGGNANVYAHYTPNNYRVTFNAGAGTCGTAYKDVTYASAYGELPVATPPGADSFVGWYTTASGEGTRVTAATIVETAGNHELFARYESTFEVTVQYKCSGVVLYPETKVNASATSLAPTIIAPEILGYAFSSWSVVSGTATVTPTDNDTATVTASAIATVKAEYTAVPTVYFKNNLEWDSVYVTFDAYTKSVDGKDVPGNNGKPYYRMTQLGSTDIFYCVIPSYYTANSYEHWAWNIAFDNKGYDYATVEADPNHHGTYDPFYEGEFTMRGDFDWKATMFIPYDGNTETRNAGTYYKTGCWMRYNSLESGYKLYANTYVVGTGGSAVTNTPIALKADVIGGLEFKAKVYLGTANYRYGFQLCKEYGVNYNALWYTNTDTIRQANVSTLPWVFSDDDASENGHRCGIETEALGDYIFTVSFGTGRPMVSVEYPVSTGDFRLVYKDEATWNKKHSGSWQQISPILKHKANKIDTVSFFISYDSVPAVELQKCTAIDAGTGAETWTKQSDVMISSITSAGVYNFKVTQNNAGTSATAVYAGEYDGKFYIRTNTADGGWNNYKASSNAMTYSEYSLTHGGTSGPYSHYFMSHVNDGQNIKFVVANDYNMCLTDTLIDDDYAHEWIETEANVRFTWNQNTNKISRAYIRGAGKLEDRFLVLEGDAKLFDIDGNALTGANRVHDDWGHYLNDNEMNFIDDQNWVYEASVKAKPGAQVKLTAVFNGKEQYFYGDEDHTYQILGGSGDDPYELRIVYDFKTNRLVTALIPAGAISGNQAINTDIMIVRYHQNSAQTITFSGGGSLSKVKTVYGAMKFNKWRLNNKSENLHNNLSLSTWERDLYWISFPFDVKLNDVFGFGTYGKHWIIEYYDGLGRAKNGFWADSPSNWKYVTKAMRDEFVLKAYEGYILALDLSELTEASSVWTHGVENVYLYFPSTANIEDIQATERTIPIDQTGYECTIDRRTDKTEANVNKDRRVADSYWHCIGSPSYADAGHYITNSGGGVPVVPLINGKYDWSAKFPYVYQWTASTNTLSVVSNTSWNFEPMHGYLVQYARDTIQWKAVNATPAPASVAARRNANYKSLYEFKLELQQDGEYVDRTFVSMRDNNEVTTDFDFNYDLMKEMNANKSNVYTSVAGYLPAAGNCLPLETEQMTTVPVGVVAKADGVYTFAMPDGTEGISVTLVDNGTMPATHTDLSIDGATYEVTLPAGTYEGRFFLQIDPRNSATMIDIVSGEGDDVQAAKILKNGIMYIQHGGELFNAQGARVE